MVRNMKLFRRCLSESDAYVNLQKHRNRSRSIQTDYLMETHVIHTTANDTEMTSKDALSCIRAMLAFLSCLQVLIKQKECPCDTSCKKLKRENYSGTKEKQTQTEDADTLHDAISRICNEVLFNKLKDGSICCDKREPNIFCSEELDLHQPEKDIQENYLKNEDVSQKSSQLYNYLGFFHQLPPTNIKVYPLTQCSRTVEEYVEKEISTNQSVNPNGSTFLTDNVHSMNMEIIRVSTYNNFPQTNYVSTIRLAKEGFYYTGEEDKVTCFACGIQRKGWNIADDPREIHQQLSPRCPFLNSRQSENVPIDAVENTENYLLALQERENIESLNQNNGGCNSTQLPFHNETRIAQSCTTSSSCDQANKNGNANSEGKEPDRFHQRSKTMQEKINAFLRNLDPLGINFDRPKYPAYAVISTRVSSFKNWPSSITQTPRDLALAGFLYAGYGDYTRCFFCGGGLRNWEPGDDPWIEHARWFPKCPFLRQNKGDEFVALVQIEHEDESISQEASVALERRQSAPCNQTSIISTPSRTESQNTIVSEIFNLVSVQSVLEMGYSRQSVKEAFDLLKSTKDVEEISGEDLIEVILIKQEDKTGIDIPPLIHNMTRQSTDDLGSELAPLVDRCRKVSSTNISNSSRGSSSRKSNQTECLISGATDHQVTSGSLDSLNQTFSSFSLEETKSLIEENRKLRDLRLCKICLENDASIAMLPCGHLCCCPDCAPAMRKCPICRQFVKGTVRTWLV